MRVRAAVKLWQRQSVSKSVFHPWRIRQVGRDERLLNWEKYTLIYYLQPFQWSLCSVLKKTKKKRKKPLCLSEQKGLHVLVYCSVQGLWGLVKYIEMLTFFFFNYFILTCVCLLCTNLCNLGEETNHLYSTCQKFWNASLKQSLYWATLGKKMLNLN